MQTYSLTITTTKPAGALEAGVHYLQVEALNFIHAIDKFTDFVRSATDLDISDVIIDCVASNPFGDTIAHYNRPAA